MRWRENSFDDMVPWGGSVVPRQRRTRWAALALGIGIWASLTVTAARWLFVEKTTAGALAAAPAHWPSASGLTRTPGRSTVVLFAHPKCSCTRASLSELNVVMNHESEGTEAFVVFQRPSGVSDDFVETDTWADVTRIPSTRRVLDRGGIEAARFGAKTSGQVVVYDARGALVFEGGITASRGHAGDNMGRQLLIEALHGGRGPAGEHEVFGCELFGDAGAARTMPEGS
jgi:hypothetical protein